MILGSSMEAMRARLEQTKLFDEKKTYYGPQRGWMLTFTSGLTEPIVWSMPLLYLMIQMGCIALSGDSLVGSLSSRELDSLHLPNGIAFLAHLCSSGVMWLLAVLPRKPKELWGQQVTGLFLLLTWILVTAPASVVLALGESVGSASYGQLPSLISSVIFADSTVFTTYFFYRAWRIQRASHADKAQLHETAMLAALLFSLIPTLQRFFSVMELLCHNAFKVFLAYLPSSWEACHFYFGAFEALIDVLLEPHWFRAYVSLMTGVYLLMCFDGPRSSLIQEGFKMRETAASSFFGSKAPGRIESLLWRGRLLVYVLLRCAMTKGFTADPDGSLLFEG